MRYSRRIHAELARDPSRAYQVHLRQEYKRLRYREMMKARASHANLVKSAIEDAIRTGRDELIDWVY